ATAVLRLSWTTMVPLPLALTTCSSDFLPSSLVAFRRCSPTGTWILVISLAFTFSVLSPSIMTVQDMSASIRSVGGAAGAAVVPPAPLAAPPPPLPLGTLGFTFVFVSGGGASWLQAGTARAGP